MTGRVVSVNTSARTGEKKEPQPQVELAREHGIRGDAHAGDWHRQVSLLAVESIQKMRDCGADVGPGRLRRERDHRGPGRARAAGRHPSAPRRQPSAR